MIYNMNYLRGMVKIRISGAMPERFINLCLTEHILLWGITKVEADLLAWISLHDFFRIRPLAACSHTKVTVLARCGLPFVLKRLRERQMLLVGTILFFLLLYVCSSYIWFIEITGMKHIPAEQIRYLAAQQGLKPGTLKTSLAVKAIEREIALQLPEAAWVGIQFTGTRAIIEVVEKTLPQAQDKMPAHLIAAKDGVIAEIIVLAGQPVVKSGNTVKKGDMLIKGVQPAPAAENQPPAANISPEFVRAKGLVKARVWYEGYAESELDHTTASLTGSKQLALQVQLGTTRLSLNENNGQPPYPAFEAEIIHKHWPLWRNREPAVESTITIYRELNIQHWVIPYEQARTAAQAKALQGVQHNIPETAQIISRQYEIVSTPAENIVRIKVNVETIEDIGQTIPVSQ